MAIRLCAVCSEPFEARRSNAETCSTKCRVARHRGVTVTGSVTLGNEDLAPSVRDNRPPAGGNYKQIPDDAAQTAEVAPPGPVSVTWREKLEAVSLAGIARSMDDDWRLVWQEKEDLRRTLKRRDRRHAEEKRKLEARCLKWKDRYRESEAAFKRLESMLPRGDSRPFLAVAGIKDDTIVNTGEDALVTELREQVAQLRADAEADRLVMARMRAEIDGLQAQVAALTVGEDDGCPEWLTP